MARCGVGKNIPPTTTAIHDFPDEGGSIARKTNERMETQAIGNEIEFISKLIKIKTEIVRLLGTCVHCSARSVSGYCFRGGRVEPALKGFYVFCTALRGSAIR